MSRPDPFVVHEPPAGGLARLRTRLDTPPSPWAGTVRWAAVVAVVLGMVWIGRSPGPGTEGLPDRELVALLGGAVQEGAVSGRAGTTAFRIDEDDQVAFYWVSRTLPVGAEPTEP